MILPKLDYRQVDVFSLTPLSGNGLIVFGTTEELPIDLMQDWGRIRSNYRLSKAEEQEMSLEYQKTILNSLREVSNSLVAYKELHEKRDEQAQQVTSAADAVRLARLRYSGGNTSYLEVLTTDTDLFAAQLILAQTQKEEAASLIEVYAALGGGWK